MVGHDWGARVAYALAAVVPERLSSIAGLALAYQPRGEFVFPSFAQAQNFWYQWLAYVDAGAEAVRNDPVGFARRQWETWSPPGWWDEAELEATADLAFRSSGLAGDDAERLPLAVPRRRTGRPALRRGSRPDRGGRRT